MVYKTLVVGVIVLFVGLGIQPAFANDVNKVYDELKDNSNGIGTSDNNEEIITFIKGRGDLNWIERRGYFRGKVFLICCYPSGLINLSGYRRSENGIEYYNVLIEKGLVYAYYFIGYYNGYWLGILDPGIVGIAIGNIEWKEYE